jgi:hypothetical protein
MKKAKAIQFTTPDSEQQKIIETLRAGATALDRPKKRKRIEPDLCYQHGPEVP